MATLQGITTTVCISPRRAQGKTICLRPPRTIVPVQTLKHFEWPEVGKALYIYAVHFPFKLLRLIPDQISKALTFTEKQ